jgi:D-alanyl-lipoteichoic acid acyltransferase DltB (MBOAT superfamily)
MVFNSIEFLYFFAIVFFVYFALPPQKLRNLFLLCASYFFYMGWRPDYAILMFGTTLIGYLTARGMGWVSKEKLRTYLMVFSVMTNLGILFVFKYYLFTRASLIYLRETFPFLPEGLELPLLDVLLPIGISFYTFQTLSYTIDVYWRKAPVEKDFITFALYVSFFPLLIAGPIERATNLLPQFNAKLDFRYEQVRDGLLLMLWGFFKKVVIADRLAVYVNAVYNNPDAHFGLPIWIATFFFAFQVYCDFSGYTDIARGAAKTFGINAMENFRVPYIAQSFHELWKRWHISLTTWFRDYLYIPLGGNRVSHVRWLTNVFLVFLISGLWHGANWTFIIWGALHGILLVLEILTKKWRDMFYELTVVKKLSWFFVVFNVCFVFFMWSLCLLVFRSNSIADTFIA